MALPLGFRFGAASWDSEPKRVEIDGLSARSTSEGSLRDWEPRDVASDGSVTPPQSAFTTPSCWYQDPSAPWLLGPAERGEANWDLESDEIGRRPTRPSVRDSSSPSERPSLEKPLKMLHGQAVPNTTGRALPQGTGLPGTAVPQLQPMKVQGDAKIQARDEAAEGPLNPGSRGHPELCRRPCLYFAKGHCVNGSNCSFCHLAHSRNRQCHLDKRHREMLRQFSPEELLQVLGPVLQEKLQALGTEFEELAAELPSAEREPRSRRVHLLSTAVRAMQLRALLKLTQERLPEDHPLRAAVAKVLASFFGEDGVEDLE